MDCGKSAGPFPAIVESEIAGSIFNRSKSDYGINLNS